MLGVGYHAGVRSLLSIFVHLSFGDSLLGHWLLSCDRVPGPCRCRVLPCVVNSLLGKSAIFEQVQLLSAEL